MTSQPGINIEALERANARLGQFIALYGETDEDHPHHDALGAAVVKSFEFTFELALITIRRFVADYALSPGQVGQMRMADVIRTAGRFGLIDPPEDWLIFRQPRNATSHEYFDEDSIDRIVDVAPELHDSVNSLLNSLREKMD